MTSTYVHGLQAIGARRAHRAGVHWQQRIGDLQHGLFTTPGTQLARIEELNGSIDRFMRDVEAHQVTPVVAAQWQEWKAQLASWVLEWRKFREEAGFFQRMQGETDLQIDRYWQAFCGLVNVFTTRWAGRLTQTMPPACQPAKSSEFWRSVGIGVAVSITVGGLLYLAKRAIVPPAPTVILASPRENPF